MPFVFGLDDFLADVQADVTARSFSPVPEFLPGEWNAEKHYSTTRVVIGRGRARIEDPTGDRFGASGWVDPSAGRVTSSSTSATRALLHRLTTFLVWVHGVAPNGTPPASNPVAARRATDALLDAVLAAIRRSRGGLVTGWSDVEWLQEARADFTYGSIATFGVQIATPVWDDLLPLAQFDEAETDAQANVDGTDTPASPEVSVEP